jgi:hypothetical protein
MKVFNAMQLKNGAKAEGYPTSASLTQPIQFLPYSQKDDDWAAWNLDWLELQGQQFLKQNARRLLKNYKLAKGIIDKSDYIIEDNNEHKDLLDILTKEDDSALELKFYPIIPNVINVLSGEFSKRYSKVQFRAVDDISHNEMLEQKRILIEENLLADAEEKLMQKMIAMGADPQAPENQQSLSPENLKSLPEIESFFRKDYRSLVEEWATHQTSVDEERFKMQELEERGFRDMLITDREFWHFRMMEDDYEVELWNPILTFYQKSPDTRYISESNYVGKIDLMTVSDAIDKFGYLMDEEQLESLQTIHPQKSSKYQVSGYQNDGTFYDPSKSHDWNTNAPGLAYRQFTSQWDTSPAHGSDIISSILNEGDDFANWGQGSLMRVTTCYWKTQRRVGYLTSIDEGGQTTVSIIDETFVPTNNPIYNNKFDKNKNAETLVFGDHIEWLWINQTYGGVKIGPNRMMFQDNREDGEFGPIYIGIDQNKIGPLRFQFKGDDNMYGCKLPVEGKVFTERNTKSSSLVDLMKPSQITYNMVNNQIADILIDELGSVVALDQNALPQHSLGDDWGKGNYAKAYVAMKDFQVLPFDTTLSNTEGNLGFSHLQVLNLEQTQRLMSRIQLANYFKNQALEVVGFTPQRLGQQVGQTNTATGVEQSVSASYAQTEVYFIQHSDYLMPRVHQMRTNLAQFYHSKKSSIRLQTSLSNDERKFFEINGTDLLLLDLNVFCKTNANMRSVLEQVKNFALTNNTTGATIYDIGGIMQAESVGTLNTKLKELDKKAEERAMQAQQAASEEAEKERVARANELKMQQDHEALMAEQKLRNNVLVAEIKSAGYGAAMDIDQNKQSDFKDAMADIKKSEEFTQTMSFNKERQNSSVNLASRKLDIEQQKVDNEKEKAFIPLQIARENKTKSELIANGKLKNKKS